uniref:Structural maintenance of chromosomes protein n=1 Tax=Strongyloides papillosus TaxID=174720 RepID=A0A0N5BHH1_STREA
MDIEEDSQDIGDDLMDTSETHQDDYWRLLPTQTDSELIDNGDSQEIGSDFMDTSEIHQDDGSDQLPPQPDGELTDNMDSPNGVVSNNLDSQTQSDGNEDNDHRNIPTVTTLNGVGNQNVEESDNLQVHQIDSITLEAYLNLLDLEIPDGIVKTSEAKGLQGRLVIDVIELENFKSYYGVKKIGPLSHGLSCVIGPNGSGKSNIFDCILFVFDYAVKKCRARKASEFIHTSSRVTCTFAKVTIHFKRIINMNGVCFDVPDSSFSVGRKITSDNKSFFYRNGATIGRDDLKTLLKHHGLGLDHDRFLILQGEVESISMLKPKAEKEDEDSLLGLLDDIIGTTRYKEPIEKVNNAISELHMKVATINAKLRDSERFKLLLDEKTRKCITESRIRNGISDLRFQKYYIYKMKAEEQCSKYQRQLEVCQDSINQLSQKITELEREVKVIEDEQANAKNELQKLQTEIEKVKELLRASEMELHKITRDISKTDELLRSKVLRNENLHKEIVKFGELSNKVVKEKEESQRKLREYDVLEEEYATTKKDAEELFEAEKSKWASEFDSKQEKVVVMKDEINNLVNDKMKLEIRMSQLTSPRTIIEEQIRNTESSIAKIISSNTSNLERKEQLSRTTQETETEIYNLTREIQSYEKMIEEQAGILQAKTEEFNDLTGKYENLVDQENLTPSSDIHKFLNSLNYSGFIGRLGDLASVDKKYDVALSTLGGGSLEMFVVGKVEDAQYLVEQLKRNKKGRGTFMCINEMNNKYGDVSINKVASYPGTTRALDLLQNMSPEYFTCFYHVFKDSVVVDSIDSASQFTSQSTGYYPRTVTLDGSVFESSGKIVGGGRPLSGLIGEKKYSNVYKDDNLKADLRYKLEKSRREVNALQESFDKLKKDKMKAENELRLKQSFLDDTVKVQQRNIEIALSGGHKRLKTSQNTLAELKVDLSKVEIDMGAYNKLAGEIKPLEAEIKKKEQKLQKSEIEFNKVKAKIDELYNNILEIPSQNFEGCMAEKKACEYDIKDCDKKIAIYSKRSQHKVNELEKNEKEINEMRENYMTLQEQEKLSTENKNKLTTELQTLTRMMNEVNEMLNLQTGIHEKKMSIIDLKNELSKKDAMLKNDKVMFENCKARISSLEERIRNSKYVFYNFMDRLPSDLLEYKDDEQFYSKRIDEAEKIFMETLDSEIESHESLMVEVPIMPLTDGEIEGLLNKEEEIEVKLKVLREFSSNSLDDDVVKKYLQQQKVYNSNLSISTQVNKVYEALKQKHSTWICQRIKEFDTGFRAIARSVKNAYRSITLGGDAELSYYDMFDPYNLGILYNIRPPSKGWSQLENLSGGEKTIASLALIFGLHEYNPTPLYIMDEVDAALDIRNVAIIGLHIKEKTANAQFIVVSLRKEMYELADDCICIWKVGDYTATGSKDMGNVNSGLSGYIDSGELVSNMETRENFESIRRLLMDPI